MGTNLNPYLHFGDSARQAMEFYREVFGGSLTVMTFGDMGLEGPDATKIMHGQLEDEAGIILMGADTPTGTTRPSGASMTVSLSGDDAPTLHRWWDQLSAGGTVDTPLEQQMWGDEFGACTDRYGVPWLVNITAPRG